MWMVQACRGCLTTEGKLERVNEISWRMFEAITGLECKPNDGYPTMLCMECRWMLKKSITYRRKCRRAFLALKQIMMTKGVVLAEDIEKVDRKKNNLESSLGLWQTSSQTCYSVVETDITEQDESENKNVNMTFVDTVMNTVKAETEQSTVYIVDVPPYSEETAHEPNDLQENYKSEVDMENFEFDENKVEISIDIDDVFADLDVKSLEELKTDDDKEDDFEDFNDTGDTNNIKQDTDDEQEKANETKKMSKKNKTDFYTLTHAELTKLALALEFSTVRAMSVEEQRAVLKRRLDKPKFVDATFRCVLCVCVFDTLVELNVHARYHWQHRGEKKCDICLFSCKKETDLLYHRASGHLYEYTCMHCSKLLYCSNDLVLHMKEKHGQLKSEFSLGKIMKVTPKTPEEMYRVEPKIPGKTYCPHCNTLITPSQMAQHIKKQHERPLYEKNVYKCDICERWYTKRCSLVSHMDTCHNYKYRCRICQEVSHSRFAAMRHIDIHKPHKSECGICQKKIPKRSNESMMLAHMRNVHQVLGKLHCVECGFNCDGTYTFYKHQLLQHGYFIPMSAPPTAATFECPQCAAKFCNEKALKTHLLLHTETADGVENACHKCQKVCDDPDELEKHVNTCNYLKKCPYCPAEKRNGLYIHVMNSHPGLPFIYNSETTLCETCGATVPSHKLPAHLLKHDPNYVEEQRTDKCPYCNYYNRHPVGLISHVLKHHGDKPWQCKVCLAKFNQKNKCKSHITKAHGGYRRKTVRCDICDKELSAMKNLKSHYNQLHGIDYKPPVASHAPVKGRVYGSVGNQSSLVQKSLEKLVVFPHMQLDLTDLAIPTDMLKYVEVQIWDYFWNYIGDAPDKFEYIKLRKPEATDGECYTIDEEELKRRQRIRIDIYEATDIHHLPKGDPYKDTSNYFLKEVKKGRKRPAEKNKRTVKSKVIKRNEHLNSESKALDTKVDFSTNIVVKKRKRKNKTPVAEELVIEENEPCGGIVLDESSVFQGDDGCQYAMIGGVLHRLESQET